MINVKTGDPGKDTDAHEIAEFEDQYDSESMWDEYNEDGLPYEDMDR